MEGKNFKKNKDQRDIFKESIEDWWLFCNSYLALAELGCHEMLRSKHKDSSTKFSKDNLYVSTIFNLKHSIEIVLKFFAVVLSEEIPDLKREGHDIDQVIKLFDDKVNIEKINRIIKDSFPDNKPINSISELNNNWIEDIRDISLKYFNSENLLYRVDFLRNTNLKDKQNTHFRYPSDIKNSELLAGISENDVKNILVDIRILKMSFRSLASWVNIYNKVK